MEISISNQLVTAFLSLILGALCASIYQVFKVIRLFFIREYSYKFKEKMKDKVFLPIINPVIKNKKQGFLKSLILAIIDFAYIIFITPIFVVFFYETSNGVVRWYVFFFSLIGFLVFKSTIGKAVSIALEYISFYLELSVSYINYIIKKQLKKLFKKKKRKRKEERKEMPQKIIISYGR